MTQDDCAKPSATWRLIRRAVLLLLIGYIAYVALLTGLQRQIIFPGTRFPANERAEPPGQASERMWLDIEDGRVEAWYFPAPSASADNTGPAVMLAHGNGEFIENWANGIDGYLDRGVSVLLPEYRGYGRSDGEPSQEAITRDFSRFRDMLEARPEVDSSRILYHGFSLGGATLAALAAERPPRAFVLQSTFTRVVDMVAFPVPDALISDPFETISVVRHADYPILVVHGRDDSVVPFKHGKRLHQTAADSEFVEHDGGHHQMMNHARYWRAVGDLLQRADMRGDKQ